LPGFLTLISPIYQQLHGPVGFAHRAEQFAAFERVVGLSR
jgi:hypothetical protein